jgi:hypothetical protein
MTNTGTPKGSKAGTIYEILRRMGIKYVGTQAGRPRFPKEADTAKRFYWRTQHIYQEYHKGSLSRDEAVAKTIEVTNDYGPLIWGQDRSNLISDQDYLEYPRQLYWNESKETNDL